MPPTACVAARSRMGLRGTVGNSPDRREGDRDPAEGLRASQLDLSFSLRPVLGTEHRAACRKELPRLSHPRPTGIRRELEAPTSELAANQPGKLAAALSDCNLRLGVPNSTLCLVAADEPSSFTRAAAVAPPARTADRTPLPGPGNVSHQVVQGLWRGLDDNRRGLDKRIHTARISPVSSATRGIGGGIGQFT